MPARTHVVDCDGYLTRPMTEAQAVALAADQNAGSSGCLYEHVARPATEEELAGHRRRHGRKVGTGVSKLADEDRCSQCGMSLLDNEGYDGLCGSCADVAEAEGRWFSGGLAP